MTTTLYSVVTPKETKKLTSKSRNIKVLLLFFIIGFLWIAELLARRMSCNYAEGLSPYENKGILGLPEKFEPIEKLNEKCELLARLISQSNHVVVHTGAGISTSAGIPDFRGPNGVWTLEREGKKPTVNMSFADAKPTKSHMILKKLVECGKVQYIISQNIDGLHLKSGLSREKLAELHGNMFVDECNVCKSQFVRRAPAETVGKRSSGVPCAAGRARGRGCRGRLHDVVLDWEHSLPESDLVMAECHSSIADLSICLGTTLQIIPSGNLPLETLKYGGKLVICNLQPTKHDNKADLIINYYVDDILQKVMKILGIETQEYNPEENPVIRAQNSVVDWTVSRLDVLAVEKVFKAKCKGVKKRRVLVKKRYSVETGREDKLEGVKKAKSEVYGDMKLEAKDASELTASENGEVKEAKIDVKNEDMSDIAQSTDEAKDEVIVTENNEVLEKENVKTEVNVAESTGDLKYGVTLAVNDVIA